MYDGVLEGVLRATGSAEWRIITVSFTATGGTQANYCHRVGDSVVLAMYSSNYDQQYQIKSVTLLVQLSS